MINDQVVAMPDSGSTTVKVPFHHTGQTWVQIETPATQDDIASQAGPSFMAQHFKYQMGFVQQVITVHTQPMSVQVFAVDLHHKIGQARSGLQDLFFDFVILHEATPQELLDGVLGLSARQAVDLEAMLASIERFTFVPGSSEHVLDHRFREE